MKLKEAQKLIHLLYEGDTDYPDSPQDDDYQLRLALINMIISEWENTPNVTWRELLETNQDQKIEAGKLVYSLPDNFRKLYISPDDSYSGIYLGNMNIKEIPIEEKFKAEKAGKPCFYLSGNNATGFKINLIAIDIEKYQLTDKYIKYIYVKKASLMTEPDDVLECSDGNFIVRRAVGELYAQDSDPNASQHHELANKLLSQMIIANSVAQVRINDTY